MEPSPTFENSERTLTLELDGQAFRFYAARVFKLETEFSAHISDRSEVVVSFRAHSVHVVSPGDDMVPVNVVPKPSKKAASALQAAGAQILAKYGIMYSDGNL